MLRARWAELRAGPLAFAAIDRRLTAMADRIGPAIAFEETRLPRRGELPPYPERLAALRAAITGRLAYLDRRLALHATGEHHDPSQDPDPLP